MQLSSYSFKNPYLHSNGQTNLQNQLLITRKTSDQKVTTGIEEQMAQQSPQEFKDIALGSAKLQKI